MTKTNLNKPKHNLSNFYISFYKKFKQFLNSAAMEVSLDEGKHFIGFSINVGT